MSTNCVLLVAHLFLFCYERDFIMSHSEEKQSEVIEARRLDILTIYKILTITTSMV